MADPCHPNAVLLAACSRGDMEAVELALTHTELDAEARTPSGATALWVAAAAGRDDIVRRLLQHGKFSLEAGDNMHDTPLHAACRTGRSATCSVLIEGGANVNAQNDAGSTPLFVAVEAGQGKIVHLLLAAGASAEVANGSGVTPHMVACFRGDSALAGLLLGVATRAPPAPPVTGSRKLGTFPVLAEVFACLTDNLRMRRTWDLLCRFPALWRRRRLEGRVAVVLTARNDVLLLKKYYYALATHARQQRAGNQLLPFPKIASTPASFYASPLLPSLEFSPPRTPTSISSPCERSWTASPVRHEPFEVLHARMLHHYGVIGAAPDIPMADTSFSSMSTGSPNRVARSLAERSAESSDSARTTQDSRRKVEISDWRDALSTFRELKAQSNAGRGKLSHCAVKQRPKPRSVLTRPQSEDWDVAKMSPNDLRVATIGNHIRRNPPL